MCSVFSLSARAFFDYHLKKENTKDYDALPMQFRLGAIFVLFCIFGILFIAF